MDCTRQPVFPCRRPGCSRRFSSLDRLVRHASKEHFLSNAAKGAAQAAAGECGSRKKSGTSLLSALSANAAAMATTAGALVTFAALFAAQWVRYGLQRDLQKAADVAITAGGLLDLRPSGYSPTDVGAFLDGLGAKGRPLYVRLQATECMAMAPLGAIAISIFCTFFLNKLSHPSLKNLNLVPFLLPLVKSLEATLLVSLMSDFTNGAALSQRKVAVAALATAAKMRLVLPIVVGLALALGLAVPARWALRFSESQYEKQVIKYVEEMVESDDEGGPDEDEEGIALDVDSGEERNTEELKSPLAKKSE